MASCRSCGNDVRYPWQHAKLTLYGKTRVISFKTLTAQWYRGAGDRLGRIVIVHLEQGALGMRVFFCTDGERSVEDILMSYAGRWSLEVCFRDLKQQLGFADSSARKRAAVERVAPFVAYIYVMLVLWACEGVWRTPIAAPPIRPWYTHKHQLSFADVLRAGQRVLIRLDVLDPARGYGNLRQLAAPLRASAETPLPRAA